MAGADLLELAIEAQGGAARFDSAEEIVTRISCGGTAFRIRFKSGALADFEGRVSTRQPRTVISPYPKPGQRGVFDGDVVRIESEEDGRVLAERSSPRDAFRSFRRNIWWDDLDLLYFGGYALWNYTNAPFVFRWPGFEVEEIEPWRDNGSEWRRLNVRFPPDIPTHSREQTFYFDDAGLLRRLDYTAEVFGGWAKAAHYCHEHKELSGLVVPTRRRVTPRRRNGRPAPRPVLVWIEVHDLELASRVERATEGRGDYR
jgi:hypothetical protein